MTTPDPEPRTTPEGWPSPTPPETPSPTGTRAPLLGFRWTPSSPNTATGNAPGSPAGGAGAELPPPPADPLDTDTPSWDSGPAPEPEPKPLNIGKRPLGEIIRGGLLGVSEALHRYLARTEAERNAELWIMTEPEAGQIATPLANVAQRYAGMAGAVDPNANDLLAAGLAAASYLIKHTVRTYRIRRNARHNPAGYDTPGDDE